MKNRARKRGEPGMRKTLTKDVRTILNLHGRNATGLGPARLGSGGT